MRVGAIRRVEIDDIYMVRANGRKRICRKTLSQMSVVLDQRILSKMWNFLQYTCDTQKQILYLAILRVAPQLQLNRDLARALYVPGIHWTTRMEYFRLFMMDINNRIYFGVIYDIFFDLHV